MAGTLAGHDTYSATAEVAVLCLGESTTIANRQKQSTLLSMPHVVGPAPNLELARHVVLSLGTDRDTSLARQRRSSFATNTSYSLVARIVAIQLIDKQVFVCCTC